MIRLIVGTVYTKGAVTAGGNALLISGKEVESINLTDDARAIWL